MEMKMNLFKKSLTLLLALALTLSLAGCGQEEEDTAKEPDAPEVEEPTEPEETGVVRLAALKGPTAMGLVKLMSDNDAQLVQMLDSSQPHDFLLNNIYETSLAAAADEVTPSLIKGDLDMACVPANLAATLYQKTEGEIVTLAVNTLGVIYIVENGNAVQSMADLKGKTIVSAGKGSTPEYALRYLLSENGIDPDADVTIDWKSEHAECVSALATGSATIAVLPQPFVTVAQGKIDSLRVALDLTEEWAALDNGSALLTGVVVARKEFVEANPVTVADFLEDYAASVDWVNDNTADAAQLIGEYGIVDAAVAEKALPYCNIVCITGEEMQEKLSGYLQVLYDADPASVGGALPEADFYYGG